MHPVKNNGIVFSGANIYNPIPKSTEEVETVSLLSSLAPKVNALVIDRFDDGFKDFEDPVVDVATDDDEFFDFEDPVDTDDDEGELDLGLGLYELASLGKSAFVAIATKETLWDVANGAFQLLNAFKDAPINPNQDIQDLETELARTAFPVLGKNLPLANRAWSLVSNVASVVGYAPVNPIDAKNIKTIINEKKAEVSDALKNGETLLQSIPVINVKVIDKKEQSLTTIFKAIAKAVKTAFNAIGCFFGLMKTRNNIEVKLQKDIATLKETVNSQIKNVKNQLGSKDKLALQAINDMKLALKNGVHELKRQAQEDLIIERSAQEVAIVQAEFQSTVDSVPADNGQLEAKLAKMDELQSKIKQLKYACEKDVKESNNQFDIAKTDETVRNFIAFKVDVALSSVPLVKAIAWFAPSVINEIESILTAAANQVVKFARENILGEKNQKKMNDVMDKVQDNLIASVTSNLKSINDVYMNHTDYTSGVKTYEKHMEIQNEIINSLPAHRAVVKLTDVEAKLLAKKSELIIKGATVAKIQAYGAKEKADLLADHTQKLKGLTKGLANLTPAMLAVQQQIIADENADYATKLNALIAVETKSIADLTQLVAIEAKMAKAETEYLNALSVLLLDYVIFPSGIPSDLHNLLKFGFQGDSRKFVLNVLNQNLAMVMDNLNDPKELVKILNEKLVGMLPAAQANTGKNHAALIHNAKALMNVNLDTLQGRTGNIAKSVVSLIDAAGSLEVTINRLEMSRVNKYMLFDALDKTIDGVVLALGKQKTVSQNGMILIHG
jgi:hypothetical protein